MMALTESGRVAGKVALVTGSTSGIGRGIAERLAAEGGRVMITGRNEERGAESVRRIETAGGSAAFAAADLSDVASCHRLVDTTLERWGRLDVLVNNAGLFTRGTLEETDEELWDQIFAINLKAPFFLCQRAVPAMRAQGDGVIINIGSVNAFVGAPNLTAYAASKGGLTTFTRNLARRLSSDGIRVHQVNPGWVLTEGEHRVQTEQEGRPEDWAEQVAQRRPFGRLLEPEDIAHPVVYLASDEAEAVTGIIITAAQGTFG